MGLFWAYFRDTLRLPFILVGGPLALMAEGASICLDTVRSVIISLRDQFFSDRCDDVFLANYAQSRGIVRAPQEPEEHWLYRVRFAYYWWSRGGRAAGMRASLINYFGFADVRIINLRDEDPTRWAEFRVEADIIGASPLFTQDQVEWAINEIKPARSKLAEILFVESVIGNVPSYSFGTVSAEIVEVFQELDAIEELYDEDTGALIKGDETDEGLTNG